MIGLQQSLARCFGRMIFFDVFGVNALLLLEFQGGAKEVLEGAPLVVIKIIHEIDQMWLIEAVIAEELAHMRPVFLFDVSAIVFVVGAGAGELSGGRPVGQIPVQMVIEEFGAIIAIKAEDGEKAALLQCPRSVPLRRARLYSRWHDSRSSRRRYRSWSGSRRNHRPRCCRSAPPYRLP